MCHLNGKCFLASAECADALNQANTREYDQFYLTVLFLNYQTIFPIDNVKPLMSLF